jgi:ISXO2-like transposase domain
MPRNRVQHQKGLSDDGFEQRYPDEAGATVVSDGGRWFRRIAEQPSIVHECHITGSDRNSARHPAFRWANTVLANIKNSLLATHRQVGAKHLPRYLGAFAWRFNRRFFLKNHPRTARDRRNPHPANALSPPQSG